MTRSTREKYRSCLSLLLFSFACCPDISTWRYYHYHMLEGVKTKCSTCLPTHPSLRLLSFSPQGLYSILLHEFGTYWGLPAGARAFTGPDTSPFSSFPWAPGPRLTFFLLVYVVPWGHGGSLSSLPSSSPSGDTDVQVTKAHTVLMDPVSLSDSLSGGPKSSFFTPEVERPFLALCASELDRGCLAFTYLSSAWSGKSSPQSNQATLLSLTAQTVSMLASSKECIWEGASHICKAPEPRGHPSFTHTFIYLLIYIHSFI